MKKSVKWYSSEMSGFPDLINSPTALPSILDLCLADGLNERVVASMTYDSGRNLCEVTVGPDHGFLKDQIISISGCDEPAFNGEWRVESAGATAVFFQIQGNFNNFLSGNIKISTPPLGFEKIWQENGKRVYRSPNILSNRPYLRFDSSIQPSWNESWGHPSRVTIAENMSSIDTFIGARAPYNPVSPNQNESVGGDPLRNGWFHWYPGISISSDYLNNPSDPNEPRKWFLIGDDRTFYFFVEIDYYGTKYVIPYGIGDFKSTISGDRYNSFLCAIIRESSFDDAFSLSNGFRLACSSATYSNSGTGSVGIVVLADQYGVSSDNVTTSALAVVGSDFYSGVSSDPACDFTSKRINLITPNLLNTSNEFRGSLRGLFFIKNSIDDPRRYFVRMGSDGVKYMVVAANSYINQSYLGKVVFDMEGPWD